MPRGGARVPTSPAVVSGPGQLSRRTDGQVQAELSDAGYGEQQAYQEIQGGAPMAGGGMEGPGGGGGGGAEQMMQALAAAQQGWGAGTGRPDEPVTAGAGAGDGPGLDALGLPQTDEDFRQADVANLPPGMVKAMVRASQGPDASPSFKKLVRSVIARRG